APLGLTLGPQIQLYYLIAVYTLVCTALMYALTQTPLGRLLNAVRDNPERVAFIGYNPQWVRYLVFVMSAFFAGIAGGLSALHYEMVSADVLSAHRSGLLLLFTFVGGSTLFVGPILGAVLMVLALGVLPSLTPAWLLYLGMLFVVVVMLAPGGLAALVLRAWQSAGQGGWRVLWPWRLVLFVSFLIAITPLLAGVEMLYRLQQIDILGPHVGFLGLSVDVLSPLSWLAVAAVGALGGGLCWLSRGVLAHKGAP
ncbi:branched-chain amino acid ABC transporter permease, partial [Rhodoferax sp. U11-2br]|uniref:branched-chain amino acid ABC transporter permease n=1 Tax=Rhodoferax sp. U11-2br TaxID=2838878 RepID=UPI001BE7A168